MAAALESVGLLGGSSRWELFQAFARSVGNPPELRQVARHLFPRLDSRPAETRAAGELADFPIGHLARRDFYLRSALARAPRQVEGQLARLLTMAGDRERLREVAEDPDARFIDRLHALDHLGKVTDLDLSGTFERLFSASGYPIADLPIYVGYLNRRGRPELKEALVRSDTAPSRMFALELAHTATTPENRADAVYFLGARAIVEGDYDRALAYFLGAAEGPANYPPTSWAISQLYIWRAQQRSWQELAAAEVDPSRPGPSPSSTP